MKKLLDQYIRFNRAERTGFIALILIILLLAALRMTMHLWVRSPANPQQEAQLAAAWQAFRSQEDTTRQASEEPKPVAEIPVRALFHFDPNTIDSAGLRELGLREKTTRMLLNWRRKGKRFYTREDLKPLYSLTTEEYLRLEPYIVIKQISAESMAASGPSRGGSGYNHRSAYADRTRYPDQDLPHHTAETQPGRRRPGQYPDQGYPREKQGPIDLNTADSQTLVRLRGIGPVLSRKIIDYRNALGGFVDHDQLLDIYRFHDTVMEMLRQQIVIQTEKRVKININIATETELSAHPYIRKPMAMRIISLREGLKGFENIEQLKQVPLMNDENYRKIALYFTVE